MKPNAHGRANLEYFRTVIRDIPELLECCALMGSVNFLIRIVASDIEAYERLFFDRLSTPSEVQEINLTIAPWDINYTTALPVQHRIDDDEFRCALMPGLERRITFKVHYLCEHSDWDADILASMQVARATTCSIRQPVFIGRRMRNRN